MALRETINYSVTGQWDGEFSASTRTSDGGKWLSTTMSSNQIIVDAMPNETYSMRTGSVDVKYKNENTLECKVINVSQDPKECKCVARGGMPTCSPSTVTLPQTGLTNDVTITVTAACGSLSSIIVNYQNGETPWATVTSGGTALNRTITISSVGAYSTANASRSFTISVMNTGVESCSSIITVTQPGPACDCDAISPFSLSVSSISTTGMAAGTVMATYTNNNNCGNVSATIQKANGTQESMICSNGDVILTNAIPETTSVSTITYTIRIFYNSVECTAFTTTQQALSCNCPSDLNVSTPYKNNNIPRIGVGNEWFHIKTFLLPENSSYTKECLNALKVYIYPHPGQFLPTGTTNTKVEFTTETPAPGHTYKGIKVYIRNVSENTTSSSGRTANNDCYLVMGDMPYSCSTFSITQDGDGCGCGAYAPISQVLRTIPQSGLPANTLVATYRETSLTCPTAITATITVGGTSTTLVCSNGEISLPSAIGANTLSFPLTHTVSIKYGNNECTTYNIRQTNVVACSCISTDNPGGQNSDFYKIINEAIPSSGIGNTYRNVFIGYLNPSKFNEDCELSVEYVSSNPTGVNGVDAYISTSPGIYPDDGSSCIIVNISVKNVSQNEEVNPRQLYFSLKVANTVCSMITITQNGQIECTCQSFIENGLIKIINRYFTNSQYSDKLIASGSTNGCVGTLAASVQDCDFVQDFYVVTEEEKEIIDGVEVVINTKFKWYISLSENSGLDRNCSLFFKYINSAGQEQDCTDHFQFIQGNNYCDCPVVPEINLTGTTIDGKNYVYIHYNIETDIFTGITLSKLQSGYMCQYIIAECEDDWCIPYTYYSSQSNSVRMALKTYRNDTGAPRITTIKFYAISNPYDTNKRTANVIQERRYESEEDILKEGVTYNFCGYCGEFTLTQLEDTECTCDGFSVKYGYERELSVGTGYTSFYATIPRCTTEEDFSVVFIDDNDDEITMPSDFIEDYYFLIDRNSNPSSNTLLINFHIKQNNTGSDRHVRFKLLYIADNGNTCQKIYTITQYTCRCEDLIEENERETIVEYDDIEAYVFIGCPAPWGNDGYQCGIDSTAYSITLTDEYGNPASYGWINSVVKNDTICVTYTFNLSANNSTQARTAYFKVNIDGMDCNEMFSLKQKGYTPPCNDCELIIEECAGISSRYLTLDDTDIGITYTLASISNCLCFSVRKLWCSCTANWLTITSGQTITATLNETTTDDRSAVITIKFLDDNNQEVNANCNVNITVFQHGTAPLQCGCSDVSSYDGSNMTIYNESPRPDGTYYISINRGERRKKIGEINWYGGMPECLTYATSNNQSESLILEVEEDNRRLFNIFVSTPDSGSRTTAAAAIAIVDRSYNPIRQCDTSSWVSRFLEFYIIDN